MSFGLDMGGDAKMLGLLNEINLQSNVFSSHGMKVSIERAWD